MVSSRYFTLHLFPCRPRVSKAMPKYPSTFDRASMGLETALGDGILSVPTKDCTYRQFGEPGTSVYSGYWPGEEVPRPLHITKRAVTGKNSRMLQNSSSRYSTDSDSSAATMDSPPEPPGGHWPLTMPKRRGGRSGLASYFAVGCARYEHRKQGHADGWEPFHIRLCFGCSLLTPARPSNFTLGKFHSSQTPAVHFMCGHSAVEQPARFPLPSTEEVQPAVPRAKAELGSGCRHTGGSNPISSGCTRWFPGTELDAARFHSRCPCVVTVAQR